MTHIPQNLLTEISSVIQQIHCGESLESTLRSRPSIKTNPTLATKWNNLCQKIRSGEWNSLDAITYFQESLKLEQRVFKVFKKQTLTSILEILIIVVLLFVWNIFIVFSFSLSIAKIILIISITVILVTATLFTAHLFYLRYKSVLRHLGWLQLLQSLRFQILMGRNFPKSLQLALEAHSEHLDIQTFYKLEMDLQNLAKREKKTIEKFSIYHKTQEYQWNHLLKNYSNGFPILPSLEYFCGEQKEQLETEMHQKGDELAFLMLLPIFVFLLPAFFISIFLPLWDLWEKF